MNEIEILGRGIDERWKKVNYDETAFSAIASAALEDMDLGPAFFRRLAVWALGDHPLPRQFDIEGAFGQPPICLYVNPYQTFFIQALVWLDSTTSVHQHSFSGAFKVIEGQSLHSQYRFTIDARVSSRMLFGTLSHLESEVLELQCVRRIEQGASFIHSVFHLEQPSVTLVVRTFGDAQTPQYEYLRPCLAVDPFYKSERLTRNLQVLSALKQVDRLSYMRSLVELVESSDLYSSFRYIRHLHQSSPNDAERDVLATAVARAHGELGRATWSCVEQVARDGFLIDKRRAILRPDHRFFLALLLNVPRRSSFLEIVRSRFQREPIPLIEQWVDELCGGGEPDLLSLDEPSIHVFKQMLRGASFEGVVRDLEREYAADDIRDQLDDLRHLYEKLQGTSYFAPVLRA